MIHLRIKLFVDKYVTFICEIIFYLLSRVAICGIVIGGGDEVIS